MRRGYVLEHWIREFPTPGVPERQVIVLDGDQSELQTAEAVVRLTNQVEKLKERIADEVHRFNTSGMEHEIRLNSHAKRIDDLEKDLKSTTACVDLIDENRCARMSKIEENITAFKERIVKDGRRMDNHEKKIVTIESWQTTVAHMIGARKREMGELRHELKDRFSDLVKHVAQLDARCANNYDARRALSKKVEYIEGQQVHGLPEVIRKFRENIFELSRDQIDPDELKSLAKNVKKIEVGIDGLTAANSAAHARIDQLTREVVALAKELYVHLHPKKNRPTAKPAKKGKKK